VLERAWMGGKRCHASCEHRHCGVTVNTLATLTQYYRAVCRADLMSVSCANLSRVRLKWRIHTKALLNQLKRRL
jgi:hypothetical protein